MARRGSAPAAQKGPTPVMVTAKVPPPPVSPNQTAAMTPSEDFTKIYRIYTELKANGERYKPIWDRISQVVGITVQPDYQWTNQNVKSRQLDEYVDDPTSAISVNQAGDYLVGIMWETGENVFKLKPSRYVTQMVDEAVVKDWYKFATDQVLYHMNHPDCGYVAALQPYAYDQFSFGTSGIGLFKNQAFLQGIDENCCVARNYGIDNTRIKEGKSGGPDYGYAIYHWNVSRIVSEFCMADGTVDNMAISQMPVAVQNAWNNKNLTTEFDLVFLWLPREDFDPKLLGRRGFKWRGVWFMDSGNTTNRIFCEESFRDRPVNIARMIKVRGEDYGRSSGTLLLSSISSVNYMFAVTQEILEKMADPALGAFGNAIFGDSVLDTSANGLTIFNSQFSVGNQPPVFPIHDVGDPEGIIKFLMPYLNEKITTAFKVDALLDFNSAKDMTATESLQRYNIRGKSLAGILIRQKNERLIPDVRRATSICWECGELGVNAAKQPDRARTLTTNNRSVQIIPEAVLQVFASGKPWYELEFNNELEKLLKTQKIQALVQIIQSITAIAALYPDIIHAVDWYSLLKDINDNLDVDAKILVSAKEFKDTIAKAAAQKAAMMQVQAGAQAASAAKDGGAATLSNAQAGAIRNGQTNSAGITPSA